MNYSSKQIVTAFATGMIAFGNFPKPPKQLEQLANNQIIHWMFVFILIWQGGGKQDIKLSLLVTAAIFALYKTMTE